MPAISEHDVADDDQAPAIAEHFKRQIDGTARALCASHTYRRQSKNSSTCILQQVEGMMLPLALCKWIEGLSERGENLEHRPNRSKCKITRKPKGEFIMAGITVSRRNLLRAGTCTLFGGAGLLRAATVPGWEEAGVPAEEAANITKEEIIRNYYSGWERKEWGPIDNVLADGFTFTSPNDDDHIDKRAFKTRCWPQADWIERFELENVVGKDNEAFVRYLCRTKNGKSFRNIEYFRFKGGKIEAIECYFGGRNSFPSAVSQGQS